MSHMTFFFPPTFPFSPLSSTRGKHHRFPFLRPPPFSRFCFPFQRMTRLSFLHFFFGGGGFFLSFPALFLFFLELRLLSLPSFFFPAQAAPSCFFSVAFLFFPLKHSHGGLVFPPSFFGCRTSKGMNSASSPPMEISQGGSFPLSPPFFVRPGGRQQTDSLFFLSRFPFLFLCLFCFSSPLV